MTALPYANENTLLIREKSHLEGKNGLLGEHEEPCTKKNQKVLGIAFWSFFLATIIQTIFAIIVNSESLLADSAAMFVDAGTYLCNLIAEKMKTRPPTEEELHLPQVELDNRIRLRRLNLELFPPMISLILLMYVTYDAAGDSIRRIRGVDPTDEEEENAGVAMMFFGGAFLIIDFINMLHFSTTDGALIPLSHIHFNVHYQRTIDIESDHTPTDDESSFEEIDDENDTQRLNLNMYSAWTHIFADFLRSSTILFAGTVSFFIESINTATADAWAALVVSVTIFVSCIPLVLGIVRTVKEIRTLKNLLKE